MLTSPTFSGIPRDVRCLTISRLKRPRDILNFILTNTSNALLASQCVRDIIPSDNDGPVPAKFVLRFPKIEVASNVIVETTTELRQLARLPNLRWIQLNTVDRNGSSILLIDFLKEYSSSHTLNKLNYLVINKERYINSSINLPTRPPAYLYLSETFGTLKPLIKQKIIRGFFVLGRTNNYLLALLEEINRPIVY